MYPNYVLLSLSYLTTLPLVFSISSCSIRMSQPHETPSIQCITCKRNVQYAPVKSDANGNQGRLLAKCLHTDPSTGVKCNFFRWLAGSRTPSLSPRLASTSQLPAVDQHGGPVLLTSISDAAGAPPASQKQSCATMGCSSTRIRKGCGRRMCKAHCLEAGGCADPAHKALQSTTAPYTVAVPPPPTPIFPAHMNPIGVPRSTSAGFIEPNPPPGPLTGAASSSCVPRNARTEPTFSSHMTELYTAQMAREEQLREDRRQAEAIRLESKRKVQQTAFVYAWMEDGVAPVLFEVQEGFVWPHFILNEAVLDSAGFVDISVNTRFNIFRFNLNHWTWVKLNHVVELKDAPRIFIKATHVQRCQDFELFLSTTSLSAASPNIRTNLARERAYVKRKTTEYELSQGSKLPFVKNTHNLSPNGVVSTPKRPRYQRHEESPTPTLTTYRPPAPPPKFIGNFAPGATRVVKKSAAARRRELMDSYDSDSGLELTDLELAMPFVTHSSATSSIHVNSAAPLSTCRINPSASSSASHMNSAASSANSLSTSRINSTTSHVDSSAPSSIVSVVPFLIPNKRISKKPRWPADFFAASIANFFDEVEDSASDTQVCSLFEYHFGRWVDYKRSTYYDHRQRWQEATLEAKQAVLSAGQTEAGCWLNFMSMTRAPRAHIKAARRLNVDQLAMVDSDVMEISSGSDGDA